MESTSVEVSDGKAKVPESGKVKRKKFRWLPIVSMFNNISKPDRINMVLYREYQKYLEQEEEEA